MQESFTGAREWLMREFGERRRKNAAYSLRAFAKLLRLPPSRLSELLSGKRALTRGMAERIAEHLKYSQELKDSFLEVVRDSRNGSACAASSSEYASITSDAFLVIADWYHFSLLSLMETTDYRDDPLWIAARLRIGTVEVEQALERLERLGLIQKQGGRFVPTFKNLATSDGVRSTSIQRGHQQLLEKAQDSLVEVAVEHRDITATTLALDPSLIPAAKKRIKAFRRKLTRFLESKPGKEVYVLGMQLFPTSWEVKEKEK